MGIVPLAEVIETLYRIDGRGYKSYKKLSSIKFSISGCIATFTKIQSDPYAPPSVLEVEVPYKIHKIKELRTPVLDFVSRIIHLASRTYSAKRGTGNSGYIGIPKLSPCIIYRSSAEARGSALVIRLYMGLPARGRRVLGRIAAKMLCEYLVGILSKINDFPNKYRAKLKKHVTVYDDYFFIRKWLRENEFVSFIANGSILPRKTSRSDKPLPNAIPFIVDETCSEAIELPSGKVLKGLVIKSGITVITGGGFHGKSTLLNSIIEGIYPHIPGDGREYVVTLPEAVYVKAEDGRTINDVDISVFINNLPSQINTQKFHTLNASGSTSMAASISEAIEAGMNIILFDEDTAATNLLYKDKFMDEIIIEEPITPLASLCTNMKNKGISIIGIMSASSAMLPHSDTVIVMRKYRPTIIPPQKIRIDNDLYPKKHAYFRKPRTRRICLTRKTRIKAKNDKIVIKFNNQNYDLLVDNPRIIEKGQINYAAKIIEKLMHENICLDTTSLLQRIDDIIHKGFNAVSRIVTPDLSVLHPFDVLWIINRLPIIPKPS